MLLIYIGKYQQKHFNLFFKMLIISDAENKHTENKYCEYHKQKFVILVLGTD